MSLFSLTLALSLSTFQTDPIGGEYQNYGNFSGTMDHEYFGQSVKPAGDYNNDGFDDLIIGRAIDSPGGLNHAGSAIIMSGKDGSTLHQWDGTVASDQLGSGVANVGDIDQDGVDDFLIGARGASGNIYASGIAYLYSGASNVLLYQLEGEEAGSWFGGYVTGGSDFDSDGIPDLLISSPGYTGGAVYDSGRVYAYSGADGALLYDLRLISNPTIIGDVTGDGVNDLIYGDPYYGRTRWGCKGRAVIYSGATGDATYSWVGPNNNSYIGGAVGGLPDQNGDGIDDFVLASQPEKLSFYLTDPDVLLPDEPTCEVEIPSYGVMVAEDLNGDGKDDIAITYPIEKRKGDFTILISGGE